MEEESSPSDSSQDQVPISIAQGKSRNSEDECGRKKLRLVARNG